MHDDNLSCPDEGWKTNPPPHPAGGEKPHRVYMTVAIPLTMDTSSVDGQHAWGVVSAAVNRMDIARRIQSIPIEQLTRAMSLQGFVEQLERPNDAGGLKVLGDQESGPVLW